MELWKFMVFNIAALLAKAVGFLWALNELFGLSIGYSLVSISASVVFLFCINGSSFLTGDWSKSKSSEFESARQA